jgi:hypothetical protein
MPQYHNHYQHVDVDGRMIVRSFLKRSDGAV